jgi:hypothetical protein
VPLALRAVLVNGADFVKDQDEKWLFQRINRVKLAPQGICVLDTRGRVLTWVQMFDSNQGVLDFLDHSLKRFKESTPSAEAVVTQRYLRYSSEQAADFHDETKLPVIARGHPQGKTCPSKNAKGAIPRGAIVARLVGRALDEQGRPMTDIVNQEHYAEDQFTIPLQMQEVIADTLSLPETGRVRLPEAFGKLCATYAHLGHLDVRPVFGNGDHQNRGEWRQCEFWAEKAADVGASRGASATGATWRVRGESEIVSEVAINGKGVHNVKLTWDGFLKIKGKQMTSLLLSARGKEKLQFEKDDHPLKKVKRDEVVFLPGGRPIDMESGVRYGILGEPVPAEESSDAEDALVAMVVGQVPEEARRQLSEALGGPFVISRDKVQEELKLSGEQKQKLLEKLNGHVQETMNFFEKSKDQKPEEREKALHQHRQKSYQKLSALLSDLLQPKQIDRLHQILLQQEGAFVLLGPSEEAGKLKITSEQRQQFQALIQELQKKMEAVFRRAQAGAKPEEIRPKLMKLHKEYAGRLEAVLTDAQRKQWRQMLGKPFNLGDDS